MLLSMFLVQCSILIAKASSCVRAVILPSLAKEWLVRSVHESFRGSSKFPFFVVASTETRPTESCRRTASFAPQARTMADRRGLRRPLALLALSLVLLPSLVAAWAKDPLPAQPVSAEDKGLSWSYDGYSAEDLARRRWNRAFLRRAIAIEHFEQFLPVIRRLEEGKPITGLGIGSSIMAYQGGCYWRSWEHILAFTRRISGNGYWAKPASFSTPVPHFTRTSNQPAGDEL